MLNFNISSIMYDKIHIDINTYVKELRLNGFSNSDKLLKYMCAKHYITLMKKYTETFGLTEDESKTKFNYNNNKHYFACRGVDIDSILAKANIQFYIDSTKQIFNQDIYEDLTELIEGINVYPDNEIPMNQLFNNQL